MKKELILKRYKKLYSICHTKLYNEKVIECIEKGDYKKDKKHLIVGLTGEFNMPFTAIGNFFMPWK